MTEPYGSELAHGYGAGMDVNDMPDRARTLDIWESEILAIADLADSLNAQQWQAPTPCPGWSVGDLVAHTIDIELSLTDDPRPEHEPDWALLPHASSDLDRFIEIGIDWRRGRTQAEIVTELRSVAARRRAELDTVPADEQIRSPLGRPITVERMIRMRTLDMWIHEQDIRTAIGSPGGWDSPAAIVTLQQLIEGLPKVWAKQAGAPSGSVLHVVISDVGRGVEAWVVAGDDGMGDVSPPVAEPDVTLTLSFADFELLTAGRADPESVRERVSLAGDPELGGTLLRSMTLTP